MEKHSVSRLSYLFTHLYLLSSDSFSSTLLSSNLSLLSASSLLCFSSVHIVGSLTSKLPSINNIPKRCRKVCHQDVTLMMLTLRNKSRFEKGMKTASIHWGFYISIGVQLEKWVPQNPPEFIAIHYCSGPTLVGRKAALLQQSLYLFNRLPASPLTLENNVENGTIIVQYGRAISSNLFKKNLTSR